MVITSKDKERHPSPPTPTPLWLGLNVGLSILSPETMKFIFKIKTSYYNTVNTLIFSKINVKPVRYRLQTMSYIAPKI